MKAEKFKVAGVTYYEDNILSIGEENEDYYLSNRELKELYSHGEKVRKYEFFPYKVELIPEPDNEYDSNAVRVEVDGEMVGHIKRGSCSRVKNLLASPDFCGVRVESMGIGPYKFIFEDDGGKMSVEKDESLPWVHIEILTESEEERHETERKKREEAAALIKEKNAKKRKEQKAKERRGTTYFIIGIVTFVLSILLIIVYPLVGIAFAIYSIWLTWYGKRLKKKNSNMENAPDKSEES